jgi:hypothetical protein
MQALPQFIRRQPLNELSFLPRRGIDDRQYGLAESKRKLPVFTTAIVSTGIHLSARPRAWTQDMQTQDRWAQDTEDRWTDFSY